MKKILFGIFVVILSIGGVCADDIKELTLDTPVNWPVSAFNRAIVRFCDADTVGFRSVSDKYIGVIETDYVAKVDIDEYGRVTKYQTRTIADFEQECGQFIVRYAAAYKHNNKISLRSLLDMCMDSSMDSFTCGNIAKALVAYSLSQTASEQAESKIDNMTTSSKRWYSEDHKFYVNVNMSFVNMPYAGMPEIKEENIYLSETGQAVGVCRNYSTMLGKIEEDRGLGIAQCAMTQQYASWDCFIALDSRQQLVCDDKYIKYQESVIHNLNMDLTELRESLEKSAVSKHLNEVQKACYKRILEEQIEEVKTQLLLFGPVVSEYSYSRWKETTKMYDEYIDIDMFKAQKECRY